MNFSFLYLLLKKAAGMEEASPPQALFLFSFCLIFLCFSSFARLESAVTFLLSPGSFNLPLVF